MIVASSPSDFAAAVDEYVFEEVAVDTGALTGAELVLVGEAHGRRETPSILYVLARTLGTRALGLEWSHDELGRYAPDFDVEALWNLPPDAEFFAGDGRYTAGHFALLRRLRDEGRLEQLILFDRLDPEPAPEDWRARDHDMAERLLAEWNGTPLLAAAGAFHVDLDTEGTMAWHVARVRPDLRTLRLPHGGESAATVPQRPRL